MTTAQHTPRPWKRQPEWDRDDRGLAVGAGRYENADILAWVTFARGDKAAESNAHLIAAAPEMRAALIRLTRNAECTCADGGPGFVCDVCEGRAALAKAEGKDAPQ